MQIVKKIKQRLTDISRDVQFTQYSKNCTHNSNEQFIICGDPRGGTTWLAEILLCYQNTVLIWEPLWISREKTFLKHNFSYRQYIPEFNEEPEIKKSFVRLFSGKILNNYLCQFTSPEQVKSANHLLFKFCRANQLLPWLTNQFEFKYAPIHFLRHPCAVVASQLKQGGWNNVNDNFKIPFDKLYCDFYTQHEEYLQSINSKVQVLAAFWCLCNSIPLNHAKNNINWITMTYESLMKNGEYELKRIERRWNLSLPESSYGRLKVSSYTTIQGSPVLDGKGGQLDYWKKQLSSKQIHEIMQVLDYFKITLYNENPFPTQLFK